MRINRGDWEGAAEQFMSWVKGGGKVLPGLVKRRVAEKTLFLSDTAS
jgi:lysozyme